MICICAGVVRLMLDAPAPSQEWPSTCFINAGSSFQTFDELEGDTTSLFMAVSCGVGGYLPDEQEWNKSRAAGYFAEAP